MALALGARSQAGALRQSRKSASKRVGFSRAQAVLPQASVKSVISAVTAAAPTVLATLPASAASETTSLAYGPAGQNDNFYAAIGTVLFVGIGIAFLILLYVKSQFEGNVSGGFDRNYFEKKEGTPSAVEAKKKGKR